MGRLDQLATSATDAIRELRLLEMPNLAPIPGVEQVPLTRYSSPRARTDVMRGFSQRKPQIMADVARGMQNDAHRWYHGEPIRQQFIYELGDQAGNERFNLFADMMAGTSSSAPVVPNIRKASYYMREGLEGRLPFDDVVSYDDAKKWVKANPPPEGYGSVGQAMDAYWAMKYLRGEQFDGLLTASAAHKVPSFGENIRGNLMPWTGDRHEAARLGMPAKVVDGKLEKQPLPPAAYPVAEGLARKWAGEIGLMPAEFQSARWMGGAARTGVRSTDPSLPHALETAVMNQARRTGEDPGVVLRNFIRGGGLLALPAAAGIATEDE